MKNPIVKTVLYFFFPLLSCSAGLLEDFTENFIFIEKNFRTVETLPAKSRYRDDFELRLMQTEGMAGDLQAMADKIGIRDVHLADSATKLFRGIKSKLGSQAKYWKDSRYFYLNDVKEQIRYLNELQFSYEKKSFIPTKHYTANRNAVFRFSRKMEHCRKIALLKYLPSDAALEEYRKRYFQESLDLARKIEAAVVEQKVQLPKEFALCNHVMSFNDIWEKNIAYFRKVRNRNGRNESRIQETDAVTSRFDEMKLLLQEIDHDRELLFASGLELYLPEKRGGKLKVVSDQIPAEPDKKVQKQSAPKRSRRELIEDYAKLKDSVYHSESRMNGVSPELYQRYRALLPKRQQAEMDAEYQKQKSEKWPDPICRGTALTKIHLKYMEQKDSCTSEEMSVILEQNKERTKK